MLAQRKLTLTRYLCDDTLWTLGLKTEIDRLFSTIRIIDFMRRYYPTYEQITLNFFSTLDFK